MLKKLEKSGYIRSIGDTHGLHIKVCEYDVYQDPKSYKRDACGRHPARMRDEGEMHAGTNNKEKKEKKENKERMAPLFSLSDYKEDVQGILNYWRRQVYGRGADASLNQAAAHVEDFLVGADDRQETVRRIRLAIDAYAGGQQRKYLDPDERERFSYLAKNFFDPEKGHLQSHLEGLDPRNHVEDPISSVPEPPSNLEVDEARWARVDRSLWENVDEENFSAWLRPLKYLGHDATTGVLWLQATSSFNSSWVGRNFEEEILELYGSEQVESLTVTWLMVEDEDEEDPDNLVQEVC